MQVERHRAGFRGAVLISSPSHRQIPHCTAMMIPKISIQIDCFARTLIVKGFHPIYSSIVSTLRTQKTLAHSTVIRLSCSYVHNHFNYFDLIRHLIFARLPSTPTCLAKSQEMRYKASDFDEIRSLMRWNLTSDKLEKISHRFDKRFLVCVEVTKVILVNQ